MSCPRATKSATQMPPPRRLDFAPKVSSPLARCIYLVSATPQPPPPKAKRDLLIDPVLLAPHPPTVDNGLPIDPVLLASHPPVQRHASIPVRKASTRNEAHAQPEIIAPSARPSMAHPGLGTGASTEDVTAMVFHAPAEYSTKPDCYSDPSLTNATSYVAQEQLLDDPKTDQHLAASLQDACHQARLPVRQNSHITSTKPASAISTSANSPVPRRSPSTSVLQLPVAPASQHNTVTQNRKRRIPQQGGQERYSEIYVPSVVVGERSLDVPRLASEEQMAGRRIAPMRRPA